MSRLLTVGFETGDGKEGGHTSGGAGTVPDAIAQAVTASGRAGYVLRCRSGAGNGPSFWRRVGAGFYVLGRVYRHRFRVNLTDLPAAATTIADFRLVGGNGPFIRVDQLGRIWMRRVVGGVATDGALTPISVNTWRRIEVVFYSEATGLAGALEFRIDGALVESFSALNLGANAGATCDIGWIAAPGANKQILLDDLAINDSLGTDQNGLPGDGYVSLLAPRKDEARGTNWVMGIAGATSDVWQGPSGVPPVGLPNGMVKNAVSDTTGNYDARLEPYSEKIPVSSPVVLVAPIFSVGCDTATATAGAEKLVSNPVGPAETATDFNSGSGVAAGWPTGWRWDTLAPVYGDVAARAVGPVVRIGKRQAVTRAAECAFMGLNVEWGPPTIPATVSADPVGLGLEMAFDCRPGDIDYSWTALDDRFRSFTLQMGRNNELGAMETGSSQIVIRDADRYLDPEWTGSPFYPNVKLRTPIRVVARAIGGPRLFTHYVSALPRVRIGAGYMERTISAQGPFAIINGSMMGGLTFGADDRVDIRIGSVLGLIGYPHGNLGAGAANMKAKTFPAGDQTSALQYLLNLADSESGVLWEQWGNSDGVGFTGYAGLVTASGGAPSITLSDQPGAGEYPYTEPAYTFDDSLFANAWSAIIAGGALQTATDATSILEHGRVEYPLFNSEAATNAVALAWCQFRLAQYKNPRQRFEALTVKPGTNTTLWGILLGLKVGSPIDVTEHLPGGGGAVTTRFLLQGMGIVSPPGPSSQTTFRLNLWPKYI